MPVSDTVEQVLEKFLKDTPAAVEEYYKKAEETSKGVSGMEAVVKESAAVDEKRHEVISVLLDVKYYIASRFPEMKEEDNAGVRVQEEVCALINKACKGDAGKEDARPTGDNLRGSLASQYLAARGKLSQSIDEHAAVEEYKMQLQELDKQQSREISYGWKALAFHRRVIADAVRNNRSKIENPRPQDYGHMAM
eukprot:NODE_3494_length_967_cov_23.438998_g3207_i0.p1 GENE.NODE_3494_length_967_cov_23.438998_g3207_i0~~NODE_3494_length_967_cov_23.438998_g3207_i0.p1  ORF type:complete len:226 (-),score=70.42 NODE_3494_length_967_cov_23.438998_g3207_i0:288-869(-)